MTTMTIQNTELYVSVIIPVFNSESTVADCINAILDQTYPKDKYEIIAIDDGSTDKTNEILKRYPIRYNHQQNTGPAAARNKGVELAYGDIVIFTDADCIPDPHWISEMVRPFADSEVVGVKGAYKNSKHAIWARLAQIEFLERYHKLSKNKYIDMVDTYSAAFRKEVFLTVGGFDTAFPFPNGEDADLSYRMSILGYKLVFNQKAMVWHAGHPDSLWNYAHLKFQRGYWRVKVYKKSPTKILVDTYTPNTLKFQIMTIYSAIGGLILAPFYPSTFILVYCASFLFVVLSFPYVKTVLRFDSNIAWLAPLFLLTRSLSIGMGVIAGLLQNYNFSTGKRQP